MVQRQWNYSTQLPVFLHAGGSASEGSGVNDAQHEAYSTYLRTIADLLGLRDWSIELMREPYPDPDVGAFLGSYTPAPNPLSASASAVQGSTSVCCRLTVYFIN